MGDPPGKHKAYTNVKAKHRAAAEAPDAKAQAPNKGKTPPGQMIHTKAGAPDQAGLMIHTKAGAPEQAGPMIHTKAGAPEQSSPMIYT